MGGCKVGLYSPELRTSARSLINKKNQFLTFDSLLTNAGFYLTTQSQLIHLLY